MDLIFIRLGYLKRILVDSELKCMNQYLSKVHETSVFRPTKIPNSNTHGTYASVANDNLGPHSVCGPVTINKCTNYPYQPDNCTPNGLLNTGEGEKPIERRISGKADGAHMFLPIGPTRCDEMNRCEMIWDNVTKRHYKDSIPNYVKPDNEYHLNNISFNFKKGNLYTILGRTLSGKTTLLKTIAGLINPNSGSMHFEDKNFSEIPVWERNVAMVYQQFINYPHMNVYENIIFPLKQRKVSDEQIKKDVNEALNTVGLVGFENRKIQELSGGQQQRVALARSLAKKAKILLLDEPLVNLDYKLREQLREEFKRIFSEGFSQETILIYSTTDPQEVMELNGEVIVLDEGKILQNGPAKEIFENPLNLKVAEISNDPPMNILKGSKVSTKINLDNISVGLPSHLNNLADEAYNFGIRASEVKLDENGEEFEIELAEISGSETLLHLKKGDTKIIALIEEVMNFKIHEKIKINFNNNKFYAFDLNGNLVSSPYGAING